jgi:acyl-CoA synthetase
MGIDLSVLLEHLDAVGLLKKKWPEHLVVVDSMRLLPIGKIDKRAMAAQATAELDSRRGTPGKA